MNEREHPYVNRLRDNLIEGRIDRREFLRSSTLLGLASTAAYSFADKVAGATSTAHAQDPLPMGGTLRIGMVVNPIANAHAMSSLEQGNIVTQTNQQLTRTGQDNITRPLLLEGWEVSEDLRTWTLRIRKDAHWRNGRPFTSDDVIWNIEHVLDLETGSSTFGLMKGYMLEEIVADDGSVTTRIWDANALERVDDHTVNMNLRVPQIAIPEHLFHYPTVMLDPEENGLYAPGSNGTGPFVLEEWSASERAVLSASTNYWSTAPYLERLVFQDLGADPSTEIGALASGQVDGIYSASPTQIAALQTMPDLEFYSAPSAMTADGRMKVTQEPFNDPRVRKALRVALDARAVEQVTFQGIGLPAEFHHVAPIHPEYAELPALGPDIEQARTLLSEAGYPDGIDLELHVTQAYPWIPIAAQAMVEQWAQADIRVTLNLMTPALAAELWNKVPWGLIEWGHRPLGIMALALGYRTGVPWNMAEYSNPEFDRLLTEAEGILDVEQRREVMRRIETIMQEDGPIVQCVWAPVFTFMHRKVKGFAMHPGTYMFAEQLAVAT